MKKQFAILLTIIVLAMGFIQAQDSILARPSKNYYKIGLIGVPGGFFFGAINFEKKISKNTSIELSANAIFIQEEYSKTMLELVYLTYRVYMPTKNKFLRNFWAGPYLSYVHHHRLNYRGRYDNTFGAGLTFGRKNFFKAQGKAFIDVGLGASINLNIETDKVNCTISTGFPYILPRLIFIFGISH